MQDDFERIQEASSKDSIVWICHVDNIESDVFYAMIFGSAKGYQESDCPDRLDSFTTEAIEGLRWLFELLSIKAHFIEGC
jgi:hypothetical protein